MLTVINILPGPVAAAVVRYGGNTNPDDYVVEWLFLTTVETIKKENVLQGFNNLKTSLVTPKDSHVFA